MNPFYFGTDERRLFGIYEAPVRAPAERAVLLCHPWGAEYTHAYRAMRQLAKLLAVAGMHVLRFDYYGTGDSGGDAAEGDPHAWETDIRTAIAELRDTAQTSRVSLVGLRLGATMAANVAAQPGAAVDSLVLWDPVVRGADYLAELHDASRTGWQRRKPAARRPARDGGGHEIMGFPLTERMAAGMRRMDLAALAPALPDRTLIVTSDAGKPRAPLGATFDRRARRPIAVESVAGEPAWIEWPIGHPMAGTLPVKALQHIVAWLA